MQQQLLQSIWQGFLQIVDGFLLPDTAASDQLAAWWTDLTATLNSFGTAISKSLMTFQNLVNGVLDTTDQDVTDLITALNDTATNASSAQGAWITVFTDLGFSVTDATTYVTWLQTLEADIGDALAGNITPLLQLLFGSGTTTIPSSGTPVAVAAVPSLPTSKITSGQFAATFIAGVLGGASLGTDLTNFSNWIWGTTTPTSTTQVTATKVAGIGGASSFATTAQSIMDYLTQAFTGVAATGNSFGQLANAASGTATTASAAQMVAQAATLVQAQQTAAKAAYAAFGDVTADVTFEVGPTYNLASMPTISVTASKSAISYIVTPDNINKLSVLFVAETVGTVTGVYINVYSVGAAGLCTNVIAGSNIVGEIGTLEAVIYDDFASALTVTPGSQWAVEVVVVGSGSLTMMGLGPSWVPTNSVAPLGTIGGFRTGTPTHDATGVGSFTSTSSATQSWSHSLASSATGILIEFVTATTVSSVKVGTATATLLGSKLISGATTAYVYELLAPPTGAQTITVTLSTAGFLAGNSDSYIGVASFGTAATSSGSAGTASVSVASAVGQRAVAAIFTIGTALSAFNQTSRWNNGNATLGYYGVFGDAAGASTVSFSATASGAWAAIGVSMVGSASPTPPGTFTPTASTSIPLFGLSANGGVSTPVFAPETASYATHGTYTYTLPTWFNLGVDFLDVIAVGPGGGGGGGIADPGSAGSNTTVTVGGTTVTASAGSGASAGNTTVANNFGGSPGNETYNGNTYFGGGASAYGYGLVSTGSSPGGGGAGGATSGAYAWGGTAGTWATHTFNPTGTTASVTVGTGGAGSPFFGAENGADGAVWLVARQA